MEPLDYYHIRRAAVLDALGGCCAVCGRMDHLQVHHNDPEDQGKSHGVGGWAQLYRLEQEISIGGHDLVVLCRDHHEQVHSAGGVYHGVRQKQFQLKATQLDNGDD